MIELLSGPLAERIRECASDNCPLVFVDSSRPGARRWCTMERCGNRHKLRAHRARRATDLEDRP
jgi:predicted RNA-binding Zn ribbon-like protein